MNSSIGEQVFGRLFCVPEEHLKDIKVIMVNLNSLLSPIFYKTLLVEIKKEKSIYVYMNNLAEIFKSQMIERYHGKNNIFYYRDIRKRHILKDVYPGWRVIAAKNEADMVALKIWDHFITVLRSLQSINMIKLIEVESDEHTFIPRLEKVQYGASDILIISRDPMDMMNCIHKDISVWNGKNLYSLDNVKEVEDGKVEMVNIHPSGIPWVLLISGAKTKIGYAGLYKWGLIKTMRFIKDNPEILFMSTELLLESDTIPSEIKDILKYKPLFFYNEYQKYKSDKK